MALQTTVDLFRTRFALPLELLRQVLQDCGISSGSLASIEPFAAEISAPGVLADSVTSALYAVMDDQPLSLTRMELLELLCIAVSGSDVESSGPALRRPLLQILIFINGVLLSRQNSDRESENKRDWPRSSEVVEDQEAELEGGAELPDNFYVLESFDFVSSHASASLIGPPAEGSVVSAAVHLEQPSQPLQPLPYQCRTAEPVPSESSLTPRKRASATAAASSELNLGKPAAQRPANLEEEPATARSRRRYEDAELDAKTMADLDPDPDLNSGAEVKSAPLLSRPAMIACALVLGFGGGMLVPRFSPKRSLPTERPDSALQPPNAKDAALNEERLLLAARLNSLPDHPPAVAPRTADETSQTPPMTSPQPSNDPPVGSFPGQSPAPQMASHSGAEVAALAAGAGVTVPPHIALANLIYSPQPLYPALAQLTHVEGEVVLAIEVAADGSVVATRVVQGQPLLRGAAEAAVRHWRFRPFVEDGRTRQVDTSVVIDVRPPSPPL